MKIRLQGHIIVPDADLDTVISALDTHIELTRDEAGCLLFNVTQDKETPNRFNVHEEFADRSAFERHQERVQESDWGKITTRVERHYEITEFE